MHLKIVDLTPGVEKAKRGRFGFSPKLKFSLKVKSLLIESLFSICSALFFAQTLQSAMHEWTQHQSEWSCFFSVASASYCLVSFTSSLSRGLTYLDQ